MTNSIREESPSFNRYYVQVKKIWDMPTVRKFSKVSATLFLVAFFLLVALKPTIETIFELNKKIADAKITESEMTTKITNLNAAMNTYERIKPQISLLDEYYPREPQIKQLIEILIVDSEKSSMVDNDFSFSAYKEAEAKGQISIRFSANNTYLNTMKFVDNLINSRRLIILKSLAINQSKEKGKLEVAISGDTFYEK